MEKYAECKRGSGIMRGMLHIPDNASADNRVPMVIMLHGFTGDRNEGFSFVFLSRMLCRAGIASARFDFMGSAESDGEFRDMSIITEREDGEAMIDYVKTLDFVDTDRIALHGMSQGGAVAVLLAAARRDDIRCVSLWSPALCIPDDSKKGSIQGVSLASVMEDGYVDMHGLVLGEVYVRDAIATDIYAEASGYDRPVQCVHGTADEIVPFRYAQRLKEVLGESCSLVPVPGASHIYNTLPHNKARLDLAVNFLSEQLLHS